MGIEESYSEPAPKCQYQGRMASKSMVMRQVTMVQRSLRFGIQDGKGNRASTWKLWTETGGGNSELYLANRSLGGTLKASFHQSGKWHIAYSKKTFEEKVKGAIPKFTDRFIEKWPRPKEIAPGITLAYRIITPHTSVTTSTSLGSYKKVIWIPNSSESKATEIDILITAKGTTGTDWPGKNSMGTSLIGSFHLNNGDRVWAVYREIDPPDLSKIGNGEGRFFKGKSKEDLKNENLRAMVFDSEADGSRVIYDYAVKLQSANI